MTPQQNAGGFTPGLAAEEPFVSGRERARVVMALFTAFIAVKAVSVVSCLMQLRLLSDARTAKVTNAQAVPNDGWQQLLEALTNLVVIPLGIAFLMWMYRVVKNV